MVQGVRAAIAERPGTADPLGAVLKEFYARLSKRVGHGIASKTFMSLVRQLPNDDRRLAARIVLQSDLHLPTGMLTSPQTGGESVTGWGTTDPTPRAGRPGG